MLMWLMRVLFSFFSRASSSSTSLPVFLPSSFNYRFILNFIFSLWLNCINTWACLKLTHAHHSFTICTVVHSTTGWIVSVAYGEYQRNLFICKMCMSFNSSQRDYLNFQRNSKKRFYLKVWSWLWIMERRGENWCRSGKRWKKAKFKWIALKF